MCVAVNLSQNTWRCVDDAYMGLDISHGQLNFNLFAQQKMYAWKAHGKAKRYRHASKYETKQVLIK